MTRLRKGLGFWRGLITLFLVFCGACPAMAQCLDPLGDLNLDASTNVVDVQCSILSTLWTLSGGELSEAPNCIFDDPSRADVNCVEGVNVSDVLIVIQSALGQSLASALDADGSGCPDACEEDVEPSICGNGIIEGNEACDDGLLNSDVAPDVCRTDCTLPYCGDGVVDSAEACDSGSSNSDDIPDACRLNCTLPTCGDGVVDGGEDCDGGPECTGVCTISNPDSVCGNGIEEEGEECDEGELNSDVEPDACRTDCTIPACGDGILDSDEDCDDGPLNSDVLPDACRLGCVFASCGDSVIDTGETCDDGLFNDDEAANACRTNCQEAGCGDGVVDDGEECDEGDDNSDVFPDTCRTNCLEAGCGDGVIDSGEECDSSPDCAPICVFDSGVCGDGVIQFGEECDGGPGCASDCTLENTFNPQPGDFVITEVMVNGLSGEQWFEVVNVTAFDLSLAGVLIKDDGGDSYVVPEGVSIAAGSHGVLGNAAAGAIGATLPLLHQYSGLDMDGGSDEIVLKLNGIELDRLDYSSSGGFPYGAGVAMSLNNTAMTPGANDDPAAWCAAAIAYDGTSYGSPGMQNPPCPDCGNGFVEPGEDCEPSLALPGENCTDECVLAADPVCGNGVVEEGEECDAGEFNSNAEPDACRETCDLPYCGDLVVDTGESCDSFFGCTEDCTPPNAVNVFPGDLIITEFMPEGLLSEGTGSWFELHNTTGDTIDLSDLIVYDNGEDYFELLFESPPNIDAGGFLVFGTNPDSASNGGVNVDVELVGVTLDLDEDELILVHTVEIDRIEYSAEQPLPFHNGYSVSLSPATQDYLSNDLPASWCTGLGPFGPGGEGSPGTTNPACPVCGDGVLEGVEECDDGSGNDDNQPDACRTDCSVASCGDGVVDAGEECDGAAGCSVECNDIGELTGVLVITELMIEPGYAPDETGEWFEIKNTTNETLSLAGMVIRDDVGDYHQVPEESELVIGPSAYLLFGLSDDPELNGGIEVDYVYDGVSLDSPEDNLILEMGTIQVDQVAWDGSYPVEEGASLSLDAGSVDAASNDEVFSWCKGLVQFGAGEFGTPGAGNVSCSQCGNGIFELGEQCDQGEANSDTVPDACRTDCTLPGCGDGVIDSDEECDGNPVVCSEECLFIIEVKPGDLVITEIMNNPEGFTDSLGEWFEVINITGVTLNLDGIWLVDDGTDFHSVDSGGSLPLEPGERFVFGSNGDFASNGGVIVDYAYDPEQFTMSNGSDEVVISSFGIEVDRVAYDGGPEFPDEAGYAMNLESFVLDVLSNDEGVNWCVATSSYGGLNFGTPGVENDSCPECGNGVIEPGEACDDGNVTPFDGCEVDCTVTVYDVCGNGIIEAGETCDDGAVNSDTVPDACRTDCSPASCGDGTVDTGEECDGGATCSASCTLEGAADPGDVFVSEIMIYPLVDSPAQARWFEVYNPTESTINMNGWTVSDDEGDSHVITQAGGLEIQPSGFLVFALSADPVVTGGLTPDYVLSGFNLDEEDEIVLSFGDTEIDRVVYTQFSGFIFPTGASLFADLAFVDASINDYGSVWCVSSTIYGSAGAGTPAASNDTCPVCGDGVVQGAEECDDENAIGGDGCDFACQLEGDLADVGDLVITEIMVDPKLTEDATGEWFEVESVATGTINLQGVVFTDDQGNSDTLDKPLVMNNGDKVVFGVNIVPALNGNLSLDWEYSGLTFGNSGGGLDMVSSGGVLIDAITWAGDSPLTEGASVSLHPPFTSAADNDPHTNWCLAQTPLDNGDFGSPGEENPPCPF